MIAWLFASFVVLHVYLTTTGYKPLTGIQAMMMGWEQIEVPGEADEDIPAVEQPTLPDQDEALEEGAGGDSEAETKGNTQTESDQKPAIDARSDIQEVSEE